MMTLSELASRLEAAAARVEPDLEVVLGKIGTHAQVIAAEFIGHELPQWKPLAESTVGEKRRLGYVGHVSATDPLLRTAHLRESIKVSVQLHEVAVGSEEKIALWQEMGTRRIPARPFMGPAMMASMDYASDLMGELVVRLLTPGMRAIP